MKQGPELSGPILDTVPYNNQLRWLKMTKHRISTSFILFLIVTNVPLCKLQSKFQLFVTIINQQSIYSLYTENNISNSFVEGPQQKKLHENRILEI